MAKLVADFSAGMVDIRGRADGACIESIRLGPRFRHNVGPAPSEAKLWAGEIRADGFVSKLFDLDDLVHAVRTVLATESEYRPTD